MEKTREAIQTGQAEANDIARAIADAMLRMSGNETAIATFIDQLREQTKNLWLQK
jgi:hypothetical protein